MTTRDKTEGAAMDGRETEKAPADIFEEIEVEDLTVDGICGVY